jgi:hypothetical protein
VNLAGIRILFELEERLGARILEALYAEGTADAEEAAAAATARPDDAAATSDIHPPTHRPSAGSTPASSTVGEP